jgi:hypothetical protein
MRLDVKNGNPFWEDAIAKEMKDVKVVFKVLDEEAHEPVNYQFMKCHIIFNVKLEDFRRKARLVAGGHMTDPPAVATYASVVSGESVRIALTAAAHRFRSHYILCDCMGGKGVRSRKEGRKEDVRI